MVKYILFLTLLGACAPKASNEMELMTKDVLKAKEGIDIQMRPLPKDK